MKFPLISFIPCYMDCQLIWYLKWKEVKQTRNGLRLKVAITTGEAK